MSFDSTEDVRLWIKNIEKSLDITLPADERDVIVMRSRAGALMSVEPVKTMRAVVLTGQISTGVVTQERGLMAMLTLNMVLSLNKGGCVGFSPANNALLLRLVWAPYEDEWFEDHFFAVLGEFSSQLDILSASLTEEALANRSPQRVPATATVA